LTVARTITMVMEWFFFRTCNGWPGVTQRKNVATARMAGRPTASSKTDTEFVRGLQMRYGDGSGTQQHFARSPLWSLLHADRVQGD
jgi:hypothetical protein